MSPVSVRVVAIDGPVGVGKSSVARQVAERLGFRHLDTGAMYRCVALKTHRLAEGDEPGPELLTRVAREIRIDMPDDGRILMDGEDVTAEIRTEEVSRMVAVVADHRAVREALVREQQRIGLERPTVLEGRDIGTVVFPDAACRIYLDASPRVRADRRVAQLLRRGEEVDPEEVFRDLLARDERDRAREWGALRVAPGARIVDSTEFSEEFVVELICSLVRASAAFEGLSEPAAR